MALDETTRKAYLEFYEYDLDFPFQLDISEGETRGSCTLHEITFESAHDEMVPAVYARPADPGQYPALVFLHGRGGKRKDIIDIAPMITGAGYAGIAIDCQYHGDRNPTGQEHILGIRLLGQGRHAPDRHRRAKGRGLPPVQG